MCKTFGDGQLWMISFSSGKKKKKHYQEDVIKQKVGPPLE